jgi:hypothetical protein
MRPERRPIRGKALLIAAIGVGAVQLMQCGKTTSGNLLPPPPCDDMGSYDCTDLRPPSDGAKQD